MQKTVILILGMLILLMFTANATAATDKRIDVIYLTDGSVVAGEITEIIPNETVKIKTYVLDNSYQGISFLQEPDKGELKIYPFGQIEKMSKVEVKFRNRTMATVRAALLPSIPFLYPIFPGWGQFYNGQNDKGQGFLAISLIGVVVAFAGLSDLNERTAVAGASIIIGSYIWSVIDANLSAKKINQSSNQKINELKLKNDQQKDVPTSLNLNYLPSQGMMASYSYRF